ncbi:hypothetical protein [Salibacterium sp. K-3]
MKTDKSDFSLKINGTDVKETKDDGSAAEETTPPIRDWRRHRSMEETAAAGGEEKKKPPRLSLDAIRKNRNIRRQETGAASHPPIYFLSLTAGAAVLGLIFGVMLLQFVSAGDSSAGTEPQAEPPGITADFNDSLTVHLIQAGAFTKESKGVEMQKSLTSEGYPGILTYDGEYYYLFTGAHLQQKRSDKRVAYFEDKGVEVYQKTRTINDPETVEGKADLQKELLQVKDILEQTVDRGHEPEGEKSTRGSFSDFLSDNSLPEKETYNKLKASLQQMEKEWPENEETSAAFQEAFIEAVLYYEQAVYEYSGRESTEGN